MSSESFTDRDSVPCEYTYNTGFLKCKYVNAADSWRSYSRKLSMLRDAQRSGMLPSDRFLHYFHIPVLHPPPLSPGASSVTTKPIEAKNFGC